MTGSTQEERQTVAIIVLSAVFGIMIIATTWAVWQNNAAMLDKVVTASISMVTLILGFYFARSR